MGFQFSLENVMSVIEQEKDQLEVEYNQAYESFQQIARTLYDSLRQKESIEEKQRSTMQAIDIKSIQTTQRFLERLQATITYYQQLFNSARSDLESKKDILRDKSIEFKKYEKLKDLKKQEYEASMKAKEAKSLDEMAVLQYVKR